LHRSLSAGFPVSLRKMNGSQQTKESAAQKASQGAPALAPPTTASNGTSSLFNKKRRKDGLKPIITNEGTGSGYVNFSASVSGPQLWLLEPGFNVVLFCVVLFSGLPLLPPPGCAARTTPPTVCILAPGIASFQAGTAGTVICLDCQLYTSERNTLPLEAGRPGMWRGATGLAFGAL